MSNRQKLMRVKLPKPTEADAIRAFEKAAEVDDSVVVPTQLNRRQLRSMRRRVNVIQVLQPALEASSSMRHAPDCKEHNHG